MSAPLRACRPRLAASPRKEVQNQLQEQTHQHKYPSVPTSSTEMPRRKGSQPASRRQEQLPRLCVYSSGCNALSLRLIKRSRVAVSHPCCTHDDVIRWVPVLSQIAPRESHHPISNPSEGPSACPTFGPNAPMHSKSSMGSAATANTQCGSLSQRRSHDNTASQSVRHCVSGVLQNI